MTKTRTPPPGPTASDLRYHVTALLALVYASAWWTFGLGTPQRHITGELERGVDDRLAPSRIAVWYQDLPPARRPLVQLPPMLRIADASAADTTTRIEAPARPVRAPNRRPGRVRTRSS